MQDQFDCSVKTAFGLKNTSKFKDKSENVITWLEKRWQDLMEIPGTDMIRKVSKCLQKLGTLLWNKCWQKPTIFWFLSEEPNKSLKAFNIILCDSFLNIRM